MTENEIKAILVGILGCWDTLTPAEVKGLLKILAARGYFPKCAACHKPITDYKDFSWDHIIPASKGGPDVIGNMQPMHVGCNVDKGSEIDEKYFCYIDPDLLKNAPKTNKRHCKTKKQVVAKKSENTEKRRNHVRLNGWGGSSYNGGHTSR